MEGVLAGSVAMTEPLDRMNLSDCHGALQPAEVASSGEESRKPLGKKLLQVLMDTKRPKR